jgi:hypothetical protein
MIKCKKTFREDAESKLQFNKSVINCFKFEKNVKKWSCAQILN